MDEQRLDFLFEQYLTKKETNAEKAELMDFILNEKNKARVEKMLDDSRQRLAGTALLTNEQSDRVYKAILEAIPESKVVHMKTKSRVKWRWPAAAAVLLCVAGSYWFLGNKNTSKQQNISSVVINDVQPGSFKARLTLSDGSTIVLDSISEGQIAQQGNTNIINKNNGLAYQTGAGSAQDGTYNTIITNNGETYSFTLADGSKVWLNAASSIHFPVSFTGKDRRVEITGEVYVNVAKNPEQPFIASANGMEVLALGTQFNIDAYMDEGITIATLVEGKVKVSSGQSDGAVILNPGQQTKLSANGLLSTASQVNTDEVTGWKEGLFDFENASLHSILKQFARWYDVEIVYEGEVKNRAFFGIVNRSATLSQVLELLQDNDIKFKIEGKKLIVKSG